MTTTIFLQHVVHVFEKLIVPALITGNRNRLCIFLNGAVHNFFHASVVTQVNHLCTARLNNAAHNIYRSIVPIEKRCSSNNSDFIFWFINFRRLHAILKFSGAKIQGNDNCNLLKQKEPSKYLKALFIYFLFRLYCNTMLNTTPLISTVA